MAFFRQRTRSEAASVAAKSFFDYLVNYIRQRREIGADEAELVAIDSMNYLNQFLGMRQLGQIGFPAVVADEEVHFRKARSEQNEKLVTLTLIADDDAGLLGEFGTRVMVTGRMARVIEEAYYQGALLDINRLCLLFPLSVRGIRSRLSKLIDQGVMLPLAGLTRKTREKFKHLRPVLAVKRHLVGEKLSETRRSLCISQSRWRQWWNGFRQVVRLEKEPVGKVAELTGYPLPLIEGWLAVWKEHTIDAQKILREDAVWPWESKDLTTTRQGFVQLLQQRHGYSPAAADEFAQQLREIAQPFCSSSRTGGQIVYIGVSSTEGPGRSLTECELKPVVLDYVTAEDWELVDRTSPGALRWARIERFATQAYAQGAALSLPDLGYLASLSTDAVRSEIREHPKVVLPTRGRIADMGSTLSHAEKIIDLFMWGYTETEIKRRTGHSYDSVERYLLDFSKVVFLKEQGLSLPEVRKVCDLSKRVAQKYWTLHEKYDTSDFKFAMSKVRRFAMAHPPKKPPGRSDGKGDGG